MLNRTLMAETNPQDGRAKKAAEKLREVEAKIARQKAAAAAERLAQEELRLAAEREAAKQEALRVNTELQLLCTAQFKQLSAFIRLKASPAICYLPLKHTESTRQLLAASKELVRKEASAKSAELGFPIDNHAAAAAADDDDDSGGSRTRGGTPVARTPAPTTTPPPGAGETQGS